MKDWRQAGVHDPVDVRRWTAIGVTPETVGRWLGAGIDAVQAVRWHEFGFTADEAISLAGKGVPPEQALSDRGTFLGLTGDDDPAARFLSAVRAVDSTVTLGYLSRQWLDDEAIAWASRGIDLPSALAWKELGLTATEAGRLARQDLTPMAVAMTWWRAGFPADEVGSWIGAGLSVQEAAEQRAEGVTAQDAEVIRALRGDDE